uniref:2-hydroxyflavanone C-arabinosyltransferase n=1 Tax=Pistia stratiotes TaxID=4477 RepID=A0A859N7Y0_PISST|nr:2-hydroxyflavanone C-arabinosyltransferase [Pistia stratiotes]
MAREPSQLVRDGDLIPTPTPHIVILPSAGMGHLTVSTRLAAALVSHGCLVTLITPLPMVSEAESNCISNLCSSFPHIRLLELHLLPFDAPDVDPFLRQFESIRRSAALLEPLLVSVTPPVSALLTDVTVFSSVVPVTKALRIPIYMIFTTCASMLALVSTFPGIRKEAGDGPIESIDIPGVGTIPGSRIPRPLHDPKHLFTIQFVETGEAMLQADGILSNTFEALDGDILAALNAGAVVPGFPPVIAVGPQEPIKLRAAARPAVERDDWMAWLDAQPPKSVLYVAFGNRTAQSREQIKELGIGLEKSGCRFLWVVKSKIVDKDDDDGVELGELLGEGYLERVGERGVVVKSWVIQEEVLAHPSVGGYLSHGGGNSTFEAVLYGVPPLIWPGGGDQQMVAAQVEKRGVGVWIKEWGLCGVNQVSSDDVAKRVREMMEGDNAVGESVRRMQEEAVRGLGPGGSSYEGLRKFIAGVVERGSSPPEI